MPSLTKNGKRVGRPLKKINAAQVLRLAKIQCTYGEMALVLGVNIATLERRFAGVIKEGWEKGKQSLRRRQYSLAMSGHPTMLIWLGKQYLGQKDRNELSTSPGAPFEVTTDDRRTVLAGRIAGLAARVQPPGNPQSTNGNGAGSS